MTETTLTRAEMKLLCGIVKHLKGPIDTDWEQAAAFAGYNSVGACRACWSRLKRNKIDIGAEGADAAEGASKKRKAGTERAEGAKNTKAKRTKKDVAAAGEGVNGAVDGEGNGIAHIKAEAAENGEN